VAICILLPSAAIAGCLCWEAKGRGLFVKELARVRLEYGFLLAGYVVMPNHVHLLMSEPAKGTVSTALQVLKQRVSRRMRRRKKRGREGQLALAFGAEGEEARSFWQARFYDFNVYSRGKVKEKLNFSMRDRTAVIMHVNPVIRKLVKHAKDWPWSSWSRYMKGGEGIDGE
jgi:putative transposase